MRSLSAALFAVVLCCMAGSAAVAASTGTIRGRVINETTGEPQPDAEVTLTKLTRGESTARTKTVRTDEDGRFDFSNLPTGEHLAYAVDARYADGLFAGSPITLPADTAKAPVYDVKLRVWETSTDPTSILVRSHRVFLVPNEEGAGAVESVTIVNPTDLAYVGRGADDGEGAQSSLGFWLPEAADPSTVRVVEADIDLPELVPTDFGFGITTAIPPGTTKVTFAYSITGEGGFIDVTRRALYSTSELSLFARDPLRIESPRLVGAGEVTIEGRSYERWDAPDGLDAADEVQAVAVADAGAGGGLLAGAGVAFGLLILLLVGVSLVRRRRREPVPTDVAPSRDEIVRAIAELDVRHDAGEVTPEEWTTERARLLGQIDLGAVSKERVP